MALKDGPSRKDMERFLTVDPDGALDPKKHRLDPRDQRITKTLRMRRRFSDILEDEAGRRSQATGIRTWPADLLDEALRDWCEKNGLI